MKTDARPQTIQHLLCMMCVAIQNLEYLPLFNFLMHQPLKSPLMADSTRTAIQIAWTTVPTQKQTRGVTAHDLEMLMSSLAPNDLGLPLLIQITLCLLQRDCTQTISADQLMHDNLVPQCNLFRGL